MQIGIDLGASKIEYVLLDDSGNEHHRERIEVPKDYKNTIVNNIDIELGYSRKELELMNAPLLEFINSSSSPYGQENNRKDNENHFSQQINSALEHFYEELEEDYTIY